MGAITVEQKKKRIDLGLLNGRIFANSAGCGFDADVVVNTQKYKQMGFSGLPAYMMGLMRSLKKPQYTVAKFVLEGIESLPEIDAKIGSEEVKRHSFDQRVLLALAANGRMFGGGMNIAPYARMDDGFLDICIINAIARNRIIKMLPKLLNGTHLQYPDVCRYYRAKKIYIELEREVNMQIDGEITRAQILNFEILHNALDIIVQ